MKARHDAPSIALAVVLAFAFGYGLTIGPLVRGGLALRSALRLAFICDTISITVTEITDNAVVLAVPGAMDAGLADSGAALRSRWLSRLWSRYR